MSTQKLGLTIFYSATNGQRRNDAGGAKWGRLSGPTVDFADPTTTDVTRRLHNLALFLRL
jgi:hypothetical protein